MCYLLIFQIITFSRPGAVKLTHSGAAFHLRGQSAGQRKSTRRNGHKVDGKTKEDILFITKTALDFFFFVRMQVTVLNGEGLA